MLYGERLVKLCTHCGILIGQTTIAWTKMIKTLVSSTNLMARLTFQSTRTNSDGTSHFMQNWIDCFGVEFRGYAYHTVSSVANDSLKIGQIYIITGATVFYIRRGNLTRIEHIKKMQINDYTTIIRVADELSLRLQFPHIQFSYVDQHFIVDDCQLRHTIDIIGIFSFMSFETSVIQVYTKKAPFDVDVNAILPQVLAAFPFMKRDISSLSMKGIRQISQGYFCYSDTILLIDRPCPESLALKIWSERQSA